MVIRVQEIVLPSAEVFHANSYPSSGLFKVVWADSVARTQTLMLINNLKDLREVRFISTWDTIEPHIVLNHNEKIRKRLTEFFRKQCLYAGCPECHGTFKKADHSDCFHSTSVCDCPRCKPQQI